jgi:hypothetical protein
MYCFFLTSSLKEQSGCLVLDDYIMVSMMTINIPNVIISPIQMKKKIYKTFIQIYSSS